MICESSEVSRTPFMGTLSTLKSYQNWNLGHAGVLATKVVVRCIYNCASPAGMSRDRPRRESLETVSLRLSIPKLL